VGFSVQWLYQLWLYLAVRSAVLAQAIAWISVLGVVTVWQRRATGWGALAAWALALVCIYLPVLPRIGHGGRYQPLIVVIILPLSAIGLLRLADRLGAARATLVTACLLIAIGTPSLFLWRAALSAGIVHIEGTHRAIGRWAREHLPGNASVAAFDIGAIGWELPARVLDVSALSSGNLVYLREQRVADLLRETHADFVMLPSPPPGTMTGRERFNLGPDRIDLVEVERRTTPTVVWEIAFGPTHHAWAGQILYAVRK
jgi:hypothetical protein